MKKTDHIVEALGTNDELTSSLGLAIEYCHMANNPSLASGLIDSLQDVQKTIQEINSHIASLGKKSFAFEQKIDNVEKLIDELDGQLPPLTTFILPVSAQLSECFRIPNCSSVIVWWIGKCATAHGKSHLPPR